MTPQNSPSPIYPIRSPHSSNDNLGIHPEAVNLDLRNVITYANANEMAMLVDRAISKGANVNYFDCYENHLLVVAVRRNQPHAISILMARGVSTPDIPENGIDILMEAAAAGHEELIDPLISMADMDVFATDANGKTALHHAVIGGSKIIVNTLLEYGAQADVYTLSMDEAELCALFGDNHNLTGENITPLMIASATGNHEIASLLLAEKADPLEGICLTLACTKGHAPMIKLLLAHQSKPKFSTKEEHSVLSLALESRASLECLKLIVAHHCFDKDDGTQNSPLGIAIKNQQPSAVALLLACGAPIEKFHPEDYTLWDEAFAKEKKPWELLDLLVTKDPLINFSISENNAENFLTIFFNNCQNIIPLSAAGFYPSLINSSQEALQQLALNTALGQEMEQQLLTAFILSRHLAKIPNDENLNTSTPANDEPDSLWIRRTYEYKQKQKIELQDHSNIFITNQFKKLRQTLSLDFYIECATTCAENRSVKNFIKNKCSTQIGLPAELSLSIAVAWSQAAQWSVEWYVAPDSIADANRFLMSLMNHLLKKEFQDHEFDGENLNSRCIEVIVNELSLATQPLKSFCNNPVAWLRKFEHRSNLRPVDVEGLATPLQIEFGLHITTCQAISNAWSTAINLARQSMRWKTSAELDKLLASALAPLIEQCMSDDFAQRIVPAEYLQNLSIWVARFTNEPLHADIAPSSRKRPATGEPNDAPPRKEARL